jgi:hypothetical protein
MAEQKYAQYVNELKELPIAPSWVGRMAHSFQVDKNSVKGSPIHIGAYFYYSPGAGWGYGDSFAVPPSEPPRRKSAPHKHHTVDELFLYFGTDPHNPSDLGGEHEIWIGEGDEAEKYMFTKTTAIFLPKGTPHGPEVCRKIYRPYFQLIIALTPEYTDDMYVRIDKYPPGWSIDGVLRELARK